MQNISIIGVGRLGLCTALIFERAGYNVLGVDVFPSYVESINNKTLKSSEPHVEEYLQASSNFKATLSLDEAIEHSNVIFVLVATPTGNGEKSYDHSVLSNVLNELNKRRVKNKHIIIGCTVLPGYIANIGRNIISDCENTTLNYNPEFIAQGSIIRNFENPDMVLIGAENDEAKGILVEIYKSIVKRDNLDICCMTAESAEITKLSVNCFITTKIAFANTIKDIADRTPNSDASHILRAVGMDSRVGQRCLQPGFGFGGPCFPRDNRALGNYAQSIGINPIIPRATDESNKNHALIMVQNLLKEDKDVYIFEDVAYKPNCPVTIIEESQPIEVAKLVAKAGKKVIISDRKAIVDAVKLEFGSLFEYKYN